jgi:hypothetical protein
MAEIKGKGYPRNRLINNRELPDEQTSENTDIKAGDKKRFLGFGMYRLFHVPRTLPGLNVGILFFLISVFLMTSCSGSKKGTTVLNDELSNAFLKYEKINVDQSDIRVPEYIKYSYVKTFYDMNHDKKPDFIKYQPFLYSTYDMQSSNGMMVWSKIWFRIDVDDDADGNFDFYVYRNPDGKLVSYDFTDAYGRHQ